VVVVVLPVGLVWARELHGNGDSGNTAVTGMKVVVILQGWGWKLQ